MRPAGTIALDEAGGAIANIFSTYNCSIWQNEAKIINVFKSHGFSPRSPAYSVGAPTIAVSGHSVAG